jgi:hypothetical protein
MPSNTDPRRLLALDCVSPCDYSKLISVGWQLAPVALYRTVLPIENKYYIYLMLLQKAHVPQHTVRLSKVLFTSSSKRFIDLSNLKNNQKKIQSKYSQNHRLFIFGKIVINFHCCPCTIDLNENQKEEKKRHAEASLSLDHSRKRSILTS